jgi:hypothetical protein
MEITTAVQRVPYVASVAALATPAPVQQEPKSRAVEYGCVDWYPYMNALERRTDWYDTDNGLAAGVA